MLIICSLFEFQVILDVMGFYHDELSVTITPGGYLIVEGWVNKDYEYQYAKNSFRRRILMPRDTIIFSASLTTDGFLIISGHLIFNNNYLQRSSSYSAAKSATESRIYDVTGTKEVTELMMNSYEITSGIGYNANVFIPKETDSTLLDSYSNNFHSAYMSSVKGILKCYSSYNKSSDTISDYRSLRNSILSENTQAWCVLQEDDDNMVRNINKISFYYYAT